MRSPLGTLLNSTPIPLVARSNVLNILQRTNRAPGSGLGYMASTGTVYAVVHKLSVATSSAQWRLYRKRGPRTSPDAPRAEVKNHLALDLWNKPNNFYTGQEFVESFQQHMELSGEAWWVLDIEQGIPLSMWPVRPDRMEPVKSATEFLSGYIYHGPDGEKVPLDRDQVVFLRIPDPEDPYRGLGPVQSLSLTIDSSRYAAEWNRNFFKNSAEPGGIIEVDRNLSDDEFREMSTRWREQHQGTSNAHRVAILEQGKWVSNSSSMRDMQFVELNKASREQILEAFGMPKSMIGIVEDVNRANAEAMDVVFARWLIKPRLERIKSALNNEYLPLFGAGDVEFDYDEIVPEDDEAATRERTSKVTAATQLVTAGWNPEDVLLAMELPPMRFVGRSDNGSQQAQNDPTSSQAPGGA